MTQPQFAHQDANLSLTPQPQVDLLTKDLSRHLQAQRFHLSTQLGELLVAMRPQSGAHWYLLAASLSFQKDHVRALKAVRNALEHDPTHMPSTLLLGELLCKAGKVLEGVKVIRSVFDATRNPSLPPKKQDPMTIRAGAILEGLKVVIASLKVPSEAAPN